MAAAKCFLSGITFFLLEASGQDQKPAAGSKTVKAGRSPNTGTYGRSTGGKSYRNIVLSGRIVTGSSPFTSLTWRSAAVAGSIYGGRAYIQKHPHERKLPPICTNSKEKSPEGRAYGYFICPREHEPDDYEYCCGAEYREYCCNKTMAQIFFSDRRKSSGSSTGLLIGIVTAVVICILIISYCCKQRKHAENIIRRFSKKDRKPMPGLPRNTLGALQPHLGKGAGRLIVKSDRKTVEFKKPKESFEGTGLTPSVPPPSYNAVTTSVLGGCGTSAVSPEPQSPCNPGGDDQIIGKLTQTEDSATYSYLSSDQNGLPHQPLNSVMTYPTFEGPGALPPDTLNTSDNGDQFMNPVELCFFSNSIITSPSTGDAYSSLCGAAHSLTRSTSCSSSTVAPNPPARSSSTVAPNPPSPSLSNRAPNPLSPSLSNRAPNPLSPSLSNRAPNPLSPSPSNGAPNQLSRSPSTGAPNPLSPSLSNRAPNPLSPSLSNRAPNPLSPSLSNRAPNQLSQSPSTGAPNPLSPSPSNGTPNPPSRSTSWSLSAVAQYPSSMPYSSSFSPSDPYSPAGNIAYPPLSYVPQSPGDPATHQPSQGRASSFQGDASYSSSAAVMHLAASPVNSAPPYTDTAFYSLSATEYDEHIRCEFLSPFI